MNTWVIEEYLGLPVMLYKMQRENTRSIPAISREKVRFGADEHQYVLVMKPAAGSEARRNIIYFIHGGGWIVGSPSFFAFVGGFFAKLGFNVIMGGYRHAPKCKYPSQLEDVCMGLAAGMKVLKQQGEAAHRVIVAGQSAGAQLAGLLVLDAENVLKKGIDPGIFSAMILISGPMDFSTCDAKQIRLSLHGFLSSGKDYTVADPIRLVRENTRLPVLCIHGSKDPIVDTKNSINFYNKIKIGQAGESKLVIARDKHHTDLLGMFLKDTDMTKMIKDFVYKIEKM